ncbi:hypothetical protein ACI2JR_09630 [Klebsiella sp. NPDC088457]
MAQESVITRHAVGQKITPKGSKLFTGIAPLASVKLSHSCLSGK